MSFVIPREHIVAVGTDKDKIMSVDVDIDYVVDELLKRGIIKEITVLTPKGE